MGGQKEEERAVPNIVRLDFCNHQILWSLTPRVPEGTWLLNFQITTRTLLKNVYYSSKVLQLDYMQVSENMDWDASVGSMLE